MLSKLGVDRVIDYRSENWWEVQELHDGGGLDVIIDLWGGVEAWNQAKVKRSPLKDTGLFVSTIGDNPYPEVHNVFEVLKMLFHIMCRKLSNWLTPEQPKYVLGQGVHADPAILQRLAQRVKEGAITPVVDASSPFDFSAEGVKQALKLQESRHAHGKNHHGRARRATPHRISSERAGAVHRLSLPCRTAAAVAPAASSARPLSSPHRAEP
eukprot:767834-Rhodomonas_salina.1